MEMVWWVKSLILFCFLSLFAFDRLCEVMVMDKAGGKGLMTLIPFYGHYLLFKQTTEMGIMFWAIVVASLLALGAYFLSFFLFLFVVAVILVFRFMFVLNLALRFNKVAGFAAGLLFLYPIYIAILAFGNASLESAAQ